MSVSVHSRPVLDDSQNQLLLESLMEFYKSSEHLDRLKTIISDRNVSLRIIDWFVTNYAKEYYTVYDLPQYSIITGEVKSVKRFKVFNEYKVKLSAYSKRRFDPFCRWERLTIPYDETTCMETTLGQMNFFKWAIENRVIDYIQQNYKAIEKDMNTRNSTAKKKPDEPTTTTTTSSAATTRKKREQLSVSASAYLKKETVQIVMKFN